MTDTLRLLSLDGGGVRGLSSLMILERLMETVNPDAPPKPCDYFNMIGGTSTGGLIAIMLGRLRMSIDECINAYISLSDRVFNKKAHRINIKGKLQGRFSPSELERVIKGTITNRGLSPDELLKDVPDAQCKVFVCATSKQTSEIIWEACRATSAASTFFDSIAIGLHGEEFVDGATGANNPVQELWNQAQSVWGEIEDRVQCVVSIGTGMSSPKPFKDDVLGIGKTLAAISTSTERIAETFQRDKPSLDQNGQYFRFNVVHGLEAIGLEESKKRKEIASATERYLALPDIMKKMQACANSVAGKNKVGTKHYTGVYSSNFSHPVSNFVPRPALRRKLEQQLHEATGRQPIVVVYGLGGAGKSQLIRDYFREYESDYESGFWITAGTRSSIESDYRRIHRLLFRDIAMVQESIEDIVAAVKSWFSGSNARHYIVFDGADSIEETDAAFSVELGRYLPQSTNVHIVITTRIAQAQAWASGDPISVSEMETSEAIELFRSCLKSLIVDEEEARDVVEELGNLALAVNLAGCYIQQTPRLKRNLESFLIEHRIRRKRLLQRMPPSASQYNANVLTSWDTSFEAIKRQSEGASHFLTLLAFIDNKEISIDLFCDRTENPSLPIKSPWIQVIGSKEEISCLTLEDYFTTIAGFSFVHASDECYSMHDLVHAWAFERLAADDKKRYAIAALNLISISVIRSYRDPQALICHVDAMLQTLKTVNEWTRFVEKRILLELKSIQLFTYIMGRSTSREIVGWLYLDITRQCNGDLHTDTLKAMSNLASTLIADGRKIEEAASLQKDALKMGEKLLADDHPIMLKVKTVLGDIYFRQYRFNEAASIQELVLKQHKETSGDEDKGTLSVMVKLADTLGVLGDQDRAVSLHMTVYNTFKKLHGDKDFRTIKQMQSLAHALDIQGKVDEAASMRRTVLASFTKVCGNNDFMTLSASLSFADSLVKQGHLAQAASMQTSVVEASKKLYGNDYLMTINAMLDLARTNMTQGKPEAMSQLEELWEKTRLQFGPDHYVTLAVCNNWAECLEAQGKPDEAEQLYTQVLARVDGFFVAEDVGILTAYRLGLLYEKQNKLTKSVEMLKRGLEGYSKSGRARSYVVKATTDLARVYIRQEEFSKAYETQERLGGDFLERCVSYAYLDQSTEFFRFLLHRGNAVAVATFSDLGWCTALHVAAHCGNARLASLLLENGADVNACTDRGNTALIWAAKRGHTPVVQVLLGSQGVQQGIANHEGMTAFDVAKEGGHDEIMNLLSKSA